MHRRVLIFLVALSALLWGVGCRSSGTGDEDEKAADEVATAPAPDVLPECFEADRARASDPLTGDIDGDGSDDEVRVVVDHEGDAECRAFVVVAGSSPASAPLPVLDEYVFELGLPAPNTLAEIDGEAGAEIVVNVHAGASTEFAGLYTMDEGALVMMSVENAPDDLVGFGGSVTHLQGADCAAGGSFVTATAVPQGRRYTVTRTFYEADGSRLKIDRETSRTVRSGELNSVEEFANLPFGSCE